MQPFHKYHNNYIVETTSKCQISQARKTCKTSSLSQTFTIDDTVEKTEKKKRDKNEKNVIYDNSNKFFLGNSNDAHPTTINPCQTLHMFSIRRGSDVNLADRYTVD